MTEGCEKESASIIGKQFAPSKTTAGTNVMDKKRGIVPMMAVSFWILKNFENFGKFWY